MHIIIGIIATIAGILFYANRISRSAVDLVDTANEIGNLPRKLRYRKKAGKKGLDLIEEPVEAAAVLLISMARMDRFGRVTDKQEKAITRELYDNMQMDMEDAEDLVIQMRSITQYLNQPDSTLFPMIGILQNVISKSDARDLSEMMRRIGAVESPLDTAQTDFIRRFKDRMGLLG